MRKILSCALSAVFAVATACSIMLFTGAKAETQTSDINYDDIVTSNGGKVEFAEVNPYFCQYNVNNHSEVIDTTNTIDKVLVLSTESSNTTFTFTTHLNRDFLTKYYNILEWFIIPTHFEPWSENGGNAYADTDFTSFEIQLTDVNNRDKYVTFRTVNRPDSNDYCSYVSGRVGANGQTINGWNAGFEEINTTWGASLPASHVGCFNPTASVPSGFNPQFPLAAFISLDYATKSVYSVTQNQNGGRLLIRDLDDGKHMLSSDEVWDGFDSKEIEVSVKFNEVVGGRTASVAILNYNGTDFTRGKIIDTKEPSVIEKSQLDGKLFGEVNRAMPIPEFFGYDNLDGYIYDVDYNVYYDYNKLSERRYAITNGKFIPDKAGNYSVVAEVTDKFNNMGKKVYDIEIRNAIPELGMQLESDLPSECVVGSNIILPKATVFGGTVNKSYSIDVLCNGELIDSNVVNKVKLVKQGLYIIRYVVCDYYGTPMYYDYYIEAKLQQAPIVDFPIVPTTVVVGNAVNLPDVTATDYYSYSDGISAQVIYELKNPDSSVYEILDGKSFIPTKEGNYKLRITARALLDSTKKTSREYDIYAKKCEYVKDYFVTDNVEIKNQSDMMEFVYGKEGNMRFINPIVFDNFAIQFQIRSVTDVYPVVKLIFTDTADENKVVTLTVKAINTKTSKVIYDGKEYVFDGTLNGDSALSISYKNGRIYNGDLPAFMLDKFDNGDEFNGFTQSKPYITIAMTENDECCLSLLDFCGFADYSYNAIDIIEPVLIMSDISYVVKIGETVDFTVFAEDLFDGECQVNTTVMIDGNKLIQTTENRCRFTANAFGKYQVRINAVDKMGNPATKSFNVYCYDTIAPVITVSKAVVGSCKVGDTVTLPTATIADNVDTELTYKVLLKKPTDSYVVTDNESFVANMAGVWEVYYYAEDGCDNIAIIKFTVTVE